jgi:hypothetical protein
MAVLRCCILFAIMTLLSEVAAAETKSADLLSGIAVFADSICGDIPQGQLTRTVIQSKVAERSQELASTYSGGPTVDETKTQEIYKGIPFEKLPDHIPTVGMCKLELVRLLLGKPVENVSMHIASVPDTIGITPNGFGAVSYVFSETGASNVVIESQDADYQTVQGEQIGDPCVQCRILGGSFTVLAGRSYSLHDNVWLPPQIFEIMTRRKIDKVNLRTVFHGHDQSGNSVNSLAVLLVYASK